MKHEAWSMKQKYTVKAGFGNDDDDEIRVQETSESFFYVVFFWSCELNSENDDEENENEEDLKGVVLVNDHHIFADLKLKEFITKCVLGQRLINLKTCYFWLLINVREINLDSKSGWPNYFQIVINPNEILKAKFMALKDILKKIFTSQDHSLEKARLRFPLISQLKD